MYHLVSIENEEELVAFTQLLATVVLPNLGAKKCFNIHLLGELGVGKTTLTRYFLRHLGVGGAIKSPTFTFVEPYWVNNLNVYHFDLYRFSDASQWVDLGFDEYFSSNSICLIEWPEKAKNYLPTADLVIELQIPALDDANAHNVSEYSKRMVTIKAASDKGKLCLCKLTKLVGKSLNSV